MLQASIDPPLIICRVMKVRLLSEKWKRPSVIYISLKHNLLLIISLLQNNDRDQTSMTELAVLPKFSRLRPVVQAAYMKTLLRDILITTSITLFGSKFSLRSFRFSQIRSVICWRVLHPLVGMFRLIINAVTSAISSASSTLRFMASIVSSKGSPSGGKMTT